MKRIVLLLAVCMLVSAAGLADTLTIDLGRADMAALESAIGRLQAQMEALRKRTYLEYRDVDTYGAMLPGKAGAKVRFAGTVARVIEGIGSAQSVIHFMGDEGLPVVISYTPTEDAPLLVVGDTVRVLGTLRGTVRLGGLDAPSTTAEFIEPYGAAALTVPRTPEPTAVPRKTAAPAERDFPDGERRMIGGFAVTGYRWRAGQQSHLALVMENPTGEDVQLAVRVVFYDARGKAVGEASRSERVFQAGGMLLVAFENDSPFSGYTCEITGAPQTEYLPVLDMLAGTVTQPENGAMTVSFTNTGDFAVRDAEARVLLMKDGAAVGYAQGYLTDSDHEIKPGATQTRTFAVQVEADSFRCFAGGYGMP